MLKKYLLFCLLFSCFFELNAQTVGLIQYDTTAYTGYTLFAPTFEENTYLIDICGNAVHTWQGTNTPGQSVYLREDGLLLRTEKVSNSTFFGGGTGGRLLLQNWNGDIVWSYEYSSNTYLQHHDVEPLQNGNILVLAWERKTNEEAIEAGRNSMNLQNGIWPEHIVELQPVGTSEATIVWEWHLWDHLIQDIDETKANFGVVSEHPELVNLNFSGAGNPEDWIHANAIDYNEHLDQIAISSRRFNEIWIIDHSTTSTEAAAHTGGNSGKGGDLLYRWGNPQTYDRGTPADQQLFGQHNVQWIPENYPDGGKLIVFNNGTNRPDGSYSSVDIFSPPINAQGHYEVPNTTAFAPENLDWTYSDSGSFFSSNISGAQRLPNGNTLICEGASGEFFEVNIEGNIVWKYINPINNNGAMEQGQNPNLNNVFRAERYAPDYSAFVGKDLSNGVPLELNPLPSDCEIPTNIEQKAPIIARIYPSPATDYLVLEWKENSAVLVEVFNAIGQSVYNIKSLDNQLIINTQHYSSGIYFLQINGQKMYKFAVQ